MTEAKALGRFVGPATSATPGCRASKLSIRLNTGADAGALIPGPMSRISVGDKMPGANPDDAAAFNAALAPMDFTPNRGPDEARAKGRYVLEQDEKVDVLLTPTTPGPAFGIGEVSGDPIQMYLNDIFTVTANMAGVPGISVPAGLSSEGTPLGLQLIGRPFDEATLFRSAQVIEDAAGRFAVPERWWA